MVPPVPGTATLPALPAHSSIPLRSRVTRAFFLRQSSCVFSLKMWPHTDAQQQWRSRVNSTYCQPAFSNLLVVPTSACVLTQYYTFLHMYFGCAPDSTEQQERPLLCHTHTRIHHLVLCFSDLTRYIQRKFVVLLWCQISTLLISLCHTRNKYFRSVLLCSEPLSFVGIS